MAKADDINLRSCQRLLAILRETGTAEQFHTIELMRLADWIVQPPSDSAAWRWADDIAVPIIRELGRRLQRRIETTAVDVPRLLADVSAMRNAQRVAAKKSMPAAERKPLQELAAGHEAHIDSLIDQHYQPSLFGE